MTCHLRLRATHFNHVKPFKSGVFNAGMLCAKYISENEFTSRCGFVENKINNVKSEHFMNATLVEMPVPDAKTAKPKATKARILLVDDDPAIRQILLRLLAEENYLVLTAANGVEALELVGITKFDLVLLDLNMPAKNGWETFEQLSTKNPLLPIILITARPNQFFPALASGVGALLEKPLDFVKLFQTIATLLEESLEVRLARVTGRASPFRYVPPILTKAEKY
jgi:CheY-like chemotaxis protein